MDKEKILKIIAGIIIILLLFFSSSFIIYKLLLNKLTKVIQAKLLEQKLSDNKIDVDELKTLLFNKVKDDVMIEVNKLDKRDDYKNVLKDLSDENEKLKNVILTEIDKKLADLKKEIKTELEIELLAKLNKSLLEKSIIISKIDDDESKDIINEFWKFTKAVFDNNESKILSYFYDPIYNFNSGSDISKTELLDSIVKFNERSMLDEGAYKNSFDINAVYFFKSGFRPPLTERVQSGDRLIVFSVNINKGLDFPFPSDENGESTFYWVKTPQNEKKIIAIGVLSDILNQ